MSTPINNNKISTFNLTPAIINVTPALESLPNQNVLPMKEVTDTTHTKITVNYSQQTLEDNESPSLPTITSQLMPDIPDMEVVLCKFSIDPNNFKSVNLSSYQWWKFNPYSIPSTPPPSPTISQRIRSLVRRAKNNHTHQVN